MKINNKNSNIMNKHNTFIYDDADEYLLSSKIWEGVYDMDMGIIYPLYDFDDDILEADPDMSHRYLLFAVSLSETGDFNISLNGYTELTEQADGSLFFEWFDEAEEIDPDDDFRNQVIEYINENVDSDYFLN